MAEVVLGVRVPEELKAALDRYLAERFLATGEKLTLEAFVVSALTDALAAAQRPGR